MNDDKNKRNKVRSKMEKGFEDDDIKNKSDLIDKDEVEISRNEQSGELDGKYITETPEDDDWNTENFDTDHSGDDLDVPGSELDDAEEEIGEEDEENNYYSIGGPRHDD